MWINLYLNIAVINCEYYKVMKKKEKTKKEKKYPIL